eukprot:5184134-Pyramimonas_sp.AAC.1
MLSRAGRGHCRIDRQDLIKPPYHSRIQFSRQFFTDGICPCRALMLKWVWVVVCILAVTGTGGPVK